MSTATFTRVAPGAYRSTNLVPVEIHRTGSGKTPWVVCVIGTHARLGTFGYEIGRFATLADAKTLAHPLVRHPQGVAAAEGWARMAERKLEGFGGHERARRHDERMASYLAAWRTFTTAIGAKVQSFGDAVADTMTATYMVMPPRAGGDGYPYFVEDARPELAEAARELGIDLDPSTSDHFALALITAKREDAADADKLAEASRTSLEGSLATATGSRADAIRAELTKRDAPFDTAERTPDGMRAACAIGAFLHGAHCAGLAAKLVGTGYSVTRTYNGGEDGRLWEVRYLDGAVTADPDAAGGWMHRVHALECAVALAEAATDAAGFGGSADPCDCGTVRGASGMYVWHSAGGHRDCTGTDAIVAARELVRLLGTDDVDVTDAARQSEAVRVLEWAREFASDCVWGDVDADDIADMDADEVIRSAARHYDGGIMAMTNDALALPFALRVADAHANQSGRLVNQLQRDAVAARMADDAAGELLERVATRSYAGTRMGASDLWRDVANDADDILQDCSALVAARIVRELPTVALRAMPAALDVNRAELVTATITERELRERADGMRGRGDDWSDVAEHILAAAKLVAGIAKTARQHMRANEGFYFAGAYCAIGELAKLAGSDDLADAAYIAAGGRPNQCPHCGHTDAACRCD